ncbi:MAG: 16S rRNA (adenine(1518)-N(6)/adenine(1519)-N(6))-dimethyltransferase RsmA [Defluviitaleaceae bacterium]|nr:16S rRNA (adenine(1518)-N(6)/adenine(1519)-N(6))-dimethyltransferase RsmA [Defluviitaleaceae bacterium]
MEIANKSRTRAIIAQYEFKFKKKFGQNFLTDANILRKIIQAADLNKDVAVIEVGPGIGALTEYLARAAGKVVAYEIDAALIPILEEVMAPHAHVEVIHEDILKADVKSMIETSLSTFKEIAVVANLPYYITTPILMGLIEARLPINRYVVMMQLEVARRLSAEPGTKDYNALSIAVQYYCDVNIAIHVPKDVFIPAPNVDSAVVVLTRKSEPPVAVKDEAFLMELVHACFKQRRKTVLNNLAAYFEGLTKEEITTLLLEIDIQPSIRGEALSIEAFGKIADVFYEQIKNRG